MKWLTFMQKPALISGDRIITYNQLFPAIDALATEFRAAAKAGDRVAIIGKNCPEWVFIMYSAWQAGMIAVPIDHQSTPDEIAYIFRDCRPALIFCDSDSSDKTRQAVAILDDFGISLSAPRSIEALADRLDHSGETIPENIGENPDDDVSLIIYTSGTTGNPKGVMLTFGNMAANTNACSAQNIFIPEDRVLVALPIHHAYPLMATIVMPMSIGAASVFTPALTGEAIIATLKQHQCTFIVAVPRLLELFRNALMQKVRARWIGRFMLWISTMCRSTWLAKRIFKKVQDGFGGHMRYISCGGAAADPQVTRDFYALGFEILEGYGMTETAPMISFTPPGHPKPGSPGKPIPCNDVRVENGEICVRGSNVMKGYYNRPEETAAILDADGWLHTGDLGHLDKDGYIHLTGRAKELIILSNGKNISPDELERGLMDRADGLFSECAVTDDGHHLTAIIVPDQAALVARKILNVRQTIMDAVIEPFNESEPSYKRISRVEFFSDPLPRTRLGKLRRHIVKELLKADFQKKNASKTIADKPTTPEAKAVLQCLEEIVGRPVSLDEHFELDLNIDSLGKMALLSSLSKALGREFPMEWLANYPTGRKLAETLAQDNAATTNAERSETPVLPPLWTHGLYRGLVALFLRCISRFRVTGRENIPATACVFAPNHLSALDAFYLLSAIDSSCFKRTYFYIIAKFIQKPFWQKLAKRHNLIQMDINGDLRQSLGQLRNALTQGKNVVIFPEGTRSMDGSLGAFRPTFAQLAKQAGVPIVPVAIKGTFEVLPRWRRFPKFGHSVSLTILPPYQPEDKTTVEEICDETRKRIAAALEG